MRRWTSNILAALIGAIAFAGSSARASDVPATKSAQPIFAASASSFDIVINPSGTLAANAAAVAAFNRAAAQWEAFIADPIQVNISAVFDSTLPAGALGGADSIIFQRPYTTVRNGMVFDAADETDDGVVAALPTAANFKAVIPEERRFDTGEAQMRLTRANYKALGLLASDSTTDATITFSSTFNFDFDNSDGVTPGAWDFESVAVHEIGHALGFQSYVDDMNDGSSGFARPMPIDLFRFENDSANDPSTLAEFTIMWRNLMPGATAITDDLTSEWLMSTGLNAGVYPGTDGRQASHWKADELTGTYVGIFDPTVRSGTIFDITDADLRALDLIGYEITIPEPGMMSLLATGALLLLRRRARFSEARFSSRG